MFLLTRDEEKHKIIVDKEEIFILTFFISPTTLTPGEASVWRDLGSFIDNDADALLTSPVLTALTRLDMNTGLGRTITGSGRMNIIPFLRKLFTVDERLQKRSQLNADSLLFVT